MQSNTQSDVSLSVINNQLLNTEPRTFCQDRVCASCQQEIYPFWQGFDFRRLFITERHTSTITIGERLFYFPNSFNFPVFWGGGKQWAFKEEESCLIVAQKTEITNAPLKLSADVIKFTNSKQLNKEIKQITEIISDCFKYEKIDIELLSDYETHSQQLCFSIYLKITYQELVVLRKQFNKKLFQLNIPIEKSEYFVFDYEREEP